MDKSELNRNTLLVHEGNNEGIKGSQVNQMKIIQRWPLKANTLYIMSVMSVDEYVLCGVASSHRLLLLVCVAVIGSVDMFHSAVTQAAHISVSSSQPPAK